MRGANAISGVAVAVAWALTGAAADEAAVSVWESAAAGEVGVPLCDS